jgi:hypothetical protein
MPRNYPEESIRHSEHGKSLKSWILHIYGEETARHIRLFETLNQDMKFRRREITQKKAYDIQNMVKVWNHEYFTSMEETARHIRLFEKLWIKIQNSDGGKLPRRKHTTFRTRQKYEIKNTSHLWGGNCKTHSTIRRTPNQDIKFRRQGITQKKEYKLFLLESVSTWL